MFLDLDTPLDPDHPLNVNRAAWWLGIPDLAKGTRFHNAVGLSAAGQHANLVNGAGWDAGYGGDFSYLSLTSASSQYASYTGLIGPTTWNAGTFRGVYRLNSLPPIYTNPYICGGPNWGLAYSTTGASGGTVNATGIANNWKGAYSLDSNLEVTTGRWYYHAAVMRTTGGGSTDGDMVVYLGDLASGSLSTWTVVGDGANQLWPVTFSSTDTWWLGSDRLIGSRYINGRLGDCSASFRAWSAAEVQADFELVRRGYRGPDSPLRWISSASWFVGTGGNNYTLTAETGSFGLTGNAANLLTARQLTADAATFTLIGQTANLLAGRLLTASPASYTLTGQAANLTADRTLSAVAGSYTLTGQDAELLAGRLLAASAGAFTLTGQDAAFPLTRRLAADAGSYTLTGQNAGLTASRLLTAGAGTYTLSGNDAALTAGRAITATTGTFTLTGNDAGLRADRLITADTTSYTLTGLDVTLTYGQLGAYTLTADPGTFTLTGQAAGLTAARVMTADPASYTLTGNAAGLSFGRRLVAAVGEFTMSGVTAGFTLARRLVAEVASYVFTGNAATLNYSGETLGPLYGVPSLVPVLTATPALTVSVTATPSLRPALTGTPALEVRS